MHVGHTLLPAKGIYQEFSAIFLLLATWWLLLAPVSALVEPAPW
jgi:hypothetical protein